MNKIFEIKKYSHFFVLHVFTPRAKALVMEFIKPYLQWGMVRLPGGRYKNVIVKVFGARTKDNFEFRFHINQFQPFLEFLLKNYVDDTMYSLEEIPLYEAVSIDAPLKEGWVLRENQIPIKAYIKDFNRENNIKLIPIQTGEGKTFTSLASLSDIGKRVVIFLKPTFIEKWVSDIQNILVVKPEEIMVVQGGAQLKALLVLAKGGLLDSKFIIISNKTMQGWIKLYELDRESLPDLGYVCNPDELMSTVKAGARLIDEAHLDFHLFFKIDLYTHVGLSIALSATLMNNNSFLEDMYKLAYPPSIRYIGGELKKYIHSFAIMYNFSEKTLPFIRTKEYNSSSYSHHAFEKSLLKDKVLLNNWLEMIYFIAKVGYFEDYKPGEKLAIFAASIEMCDTITQYFSERHSNLTVKKYTAEDPYENVIESDIRVTTIGSAGAAIDIPNLKTTIQTVSIDSIQANIQTLGRLRKNDNFTCKFYYISCEGIPKQMDYSDRRKKMLFERAASFKELSYPHILKGSHDKRA